MNARRYNESGPPEVTSRIGFPKHTKWQRVADFTSVRKAVKSGRKRRFAIVSPLIPIRSTSKPMRRILIFDNHPNSLRLASKELNVEDEFTVTGARNDWLRTILIVALASIVLLLTMLWPLA